MFTRPYLQIERNVLTRDDYWDDGGDEGENADFTPQEQSLFAVNRR